MKKAVLFLILLVLALASCDNPATKVTTKVSSLGRGWYILSALDTIAGHEYVIAVSNGGGCAMQHAESCWCLKDTACFISGQCSYFVGDTDEGL